MKLVIELDAAQYALLLTSLSQAETDSRTLGWTERVERIQALTTYISAENVQVKFEEVA